MSSYIFENVEFKNQYPVNAFVTSIQSSSYHWHYEYEMIAVLKGSITMSVSPKQITLNRGDVVLVNSKIVHEIQSNEDNLCMILQLEPALFKKDSGDNFYYRFYLNSVACEVAPQKEYSYFYQKAAKIVSLILQQNEKSGYRIRAEVYNLIADLFEYVHYDMCMRTEQSDRNAELLMTMIDYLKSNLSERDLVSNLYKELGMSEKTVYRYLKEHVGISLKEMIDTLRTDKAKRLLKNTDKNMGYIIDECGFGSENTFYRIFRQRNGLTPKEYRQRGLVEGEKPRLKGYLDFEENEAKVILQKILEEQQ